MACIFIGLYVARTGGGKICIGAKIIRPHSLSACTLQRFLVRNVYLSYISGILIRAQADDNDNVIVKFHSAKSSQYPGFSCRVSSQVKPLNQSSFGSVIDVGHIDVSESESTSPGNNSSTADNGSKLSEEHGAVLTLGFIYIYC